VRRLRDESTTVDSGGSGGSVGGDAFIQFGVFPELGGCAANLGSGAVVQTKGPAIGSAERLDPLR
jgi:hypothetical protein